MLGTAWAKHCRHGSGPEFEKRNAVCKDEKKTWQAKSFLLLNRAGFEPATNGLKSPLLYQLS